VAATTTISVDTDPAGAAEPASGTLLPATHASETAPCPTHDEEKPGEACLQASLIRASADVAAHEDLIRALRSLGIRIETA
jgi:hypothetical protein